MKELLCENRISKDQAEKRDKRRIGKRKHTREEHVKTRTAKKIMHKQEQTKKMRKEKQ